MNRLFGNAKPRGPAPNLTDSIANLDNRGDSVEKKIQKLDVSNICNVLYFLSLYIICYLLEK